MQHIALFSLWYPTSFDALSGSFVRQQALVLAQEYRVSVLYVCYNQAIQRPHLEKKITGNLREYIYYGPKKKERWSNRYMVLKALYETAERERGPINLCHLHCISSHLLTVATLASYSRVPFFITEHWSGYFTGEYLKKNKLIRLLYQKLVRRASGLLPVSEPLAEAMRACGITSEHYTVIPNVVEAAFFQAPINTPSENPHKFNFLHVSCFDEASKNILGLVQGFALLKQKTQDFVCHLVGTGPDFKRIQEEINRLELQNYLVLEGEKPLKDMPQIYQHSDCLVMNSNYETFGLIFAESLASGLPIVSTEVGIFSRDLAQKAGRLVKRNDPEDLSQQLYYMMQHRGHYLGEDLRALAQKYSEASVLSQLNGVYH